MGTGFPVWTLMVAISASSMDVGNAGHTKQYE